MAERAAAGEQLALVREQVRRARPRAVEPVAERLPVARVLVDVPLAHLDRPFDYLVPASAASSAVPGARVRVRFAGRLVDGFVLDRITASEHPGRLGRLARVVSAEPVLTPAIAALARAVVDRYAGTLADVLRLAVPPRHAAVEAQPSPPALLDPDPPVPGGWADYPTGEAFLAALGRGEAPRAVWSALPGERWATCLAAAVRATLASSRGALVVLPDNRDVVRVDAALTAALGGPDQHVALTADLGPAERYRRWLLVRRGAVRAVVGTRASAFGPVERLGLVALWDDGDDLHAEPRAPYPHAREVLLLRATSEHTAVLIGGYARTAEGAALVESGWAHPLAAARLLVRRRAPRVRVSGEDVELARDPGAHSARLPTLAWRTARAALERGPVLVSVPRAGYVPGLACQDCRAPARCPHCAGPLGRPALAAPPTCRWCGRAAADWRCPACGGTTLRAATSGSSRTAYELGRAFPGVPVRVSGRDRQVLATVGGEPALVIATPGAEPVADGGYAAALLMDAHRQLARPALRAAEEALRRWLAAAALVRPSGEGGVVVVMADPGVPAVQALVRWDPAGAATRELADRVSAGLPPAVRIAELSGAPTDVEDLLARVSVPPGGGVLGPVPAGDDVRVLVRVPRSAGSALSAALRAAAAVRTAGRLGGHVRIRVDPVDLA